MTDNESFMDQFNDGSQEPSGATRWHPAAQQPATNRRGWRDKFRGRKANDKSDESDKERPSKPSKPPRTGPSFGARVTSAGKRLGAGLTQSLIQSHDWAGVIGALLLLTVVWPLVQQLQLSRQELLVGTGVGVVLSVGLLWLGLLMHKLHRRPGPWTSIAAGIVLMVILAIAAAVCVKRPLWWPMVAVVLGVFFACGDWVYRHHAQRLQAQLVARINRRANRRAAARVRAVLRSAQETSDRVTASARELVRGINSWNATVPATTELVDKISKAHNSADEHVNTAEAHTKTVHVNLTKADAILADVQSEIQREVNGLKPSIYDEQKALAHRDVDQAHQAELAQVREEARHTTQGRLDEQQQRHDDERKAMQTAHDDVVTDLQSQIERLKEELRQRLDGQQREVYTASQAQPVDPVVPRQEVIDERGSYLGDYQ